MAAPAKDDRIRSDKARVFISHRAVTVGIFSAGWLAVALALGLIVRGSPAERGMAALVTAYRDRRPIEARLSGGFEAGVFEASEARPDAPKTHDGDRSDADNSAGEILREAVVDSGDGYSQLAYGRFLLTEGSTAEALQPLRRAVEMMPSSAEARNDLGVYFMERQEPEHAIEEFNQALLLDPGMPEGWFNRSLCYQRLLLLDAARDGFSYLERHEGNLGWRSEVRQRLEQTSSPITPLERQGEIIAAFDRAFNRDDWDEARRITRQNLEVMTRRVLVGSVVADYLGRAVAGDTGAAQRWLRQIELIGKEFYEATGDTSITDVGIYLNQLSSAQRASELLLFEDYLGALKRNNAANALEVRPVLKRLAQEFGARGNTAYAIICAHDAANCDYNLGEMNRAAVDLEKAIKLVEQHRWPYRRAQLATMLGLLYSRLGSDLLGIKYCDEALRIAKGLLPHTEAKALQYLSVAYHRMGDYDKTLEYLRRSTRLYLTNIPNPQDLGSNYSDTAGVYSLRGDHELALLYGTQALRFFAQANDHKRQAQAYSFIAVELARLGHFERAEQELQRALDQLQEIPLDGRSYTESQVFRRAGELALARGQTDLALDHYWKAEEQAKKSEDHSLSLINVLRGRAEAHAKAGEPDKARSALEAGIDLLAGYRVGISERSTKSDFLDANYAVVDQLVELHADARAQLSDAFAVLEESRARALQDDFRQPHNGGNRAGRLNPEMLSQEMPDNLSMIVYAVTSQRTYIFVIKRSGWSYETSPATTEILDRLVHDYIVDLKGMASIAELQEKGSDLYDYLIKPVESRLKDGNGLCIVPDKALHFLPFASLVDGSRNYLIQSYRLSYSPSASILIRCIEEAHRKPFRSSETILAVGNPRFNFTEFNKLSDLPDAEQEALKSASYYGNRATLIGPEATKQRVLAALKECDVAHFAVHCLVEEKSPWLAALLLADPNPISAQRHSLPDAPRGDAFRGSPEVGANSLTGVARPNRAVNERNRPPENASLLYLDEVYNLTLPRTRLVVLSACQSGLGQYYRGEGLVSLVRPFLSLGVPNVVASLWSVQSRPTALLMTDFHSRRRAESLETSEALRAAQLAMAKGDTLNHPIFWAPFISVGFDR